jgi:ketosteroid isomerase-like protein
MTPSEWIEEYIRAWHESDAEAAGRLFTDDALYCWHPLQPPAVGREGVEDYWQNVTATQEGQEVRFGSPTASGNQVAVEFWATMRNDGADVTLAGCMLLRFAADGRCEELREYWFIESGTHSPPPNWGR